MLQHATHQATSKWQLDAWHNDSWSCRRTCWNSQQLLHCFCNFFCRTLLWERKPALWLWLLPFFLPAGSYEDKATLGNEMYTAEMCADPSTFRNLKCWVSQCVSPPFYSLYPLFFHLDFPLNNGGDPLLMWLFGLRFLSSQRMCTMSKNQTHRLSFVPEVMWNRNPGHL